MQKFLLTVILISLCKILLSQEQAGDIRVMQDSRVDSLVKKHIELNKKNPHIAGWRINIFFESGNNSKRMAMEAKAKFVQTYAEIPCYVIFQEPYYKVRVGDYRTQMEAEKFLKTIMHEYPNAFVVEDEINFPLLETSQ